MNSKPKSDRQPYPEDARNRDIRRSGVAQVRGQVNELLKDFEKQTEESGEEPRADEFWDIIDRIWSILDNYNGEKSNVY